MKGGEGLVYTKVDFEKLYQTYYMEVFSYVMTIVKSAGQAEEITQEVFFKALKTENRYSGKSSELTWLCAIAKNACMDVLRRESRFGEYDEEALSERPAEGVSIERMLEDEAATLEIHQILHRLEEPYKEVFNLRVFGELSFQKIGQIFGKTESWARVTYHRARIKIQERMENR